MSDLVERLRERADYEGYPGSALILESADEIERLRARLAKVERDAARYRFIKQWVRRLDITGYSLTNNEHFEPRIDEAIQLRPADSASPAPTLPTLPTPEQINHFIECAAIELAHARKFVTSREKMHSDGVELYDMVLNSARAIRDALRAADSADAARNSHHE